MRAKQITDIFKGQRTKFSGHRWRSKKETIQLLLSKPLHDKKDKEVNYTLWREISRVQIFANFANFSRFRKIKYPRNVSRSRIRENLYPRKKD